MMLHSLLSATELSQEALQALYKQTVSLHSATEGCYSYLQNKTVATLLCEPSTRTRISFELAAKRLGALTVDVSPQQSSLVKGETLEDTVETLLAMNVEAVVLRHTSATLIYTLADYFKGRVALLNAGNGCDDHPTQALLDAFTLAHQWGELNTLAGKTIAIVGDLAHSRVFRAHVKLASLTGLSLLAVAPPYFMPSLDEQEQLVATCSTLHFSNALQDAIDHADAIMALRIQHERLTQFDPHHEADYKSHYQLNDANWFAKSRSKSTLLLHPGPVNYGVELTAGLAHNLAISLIQKQVSMGVSTRMACLLRAFNALSL
jgi:aspartate carbamoyltransferase catalytic subunit